MKQAVHEYLEALEAGNLEAVVALFEEDGWVLSPFLGRMSAREFFPKVIDASSGAKLTTHDVLVSAERYPRAAAYFRYDWWLRDGPKVSFECADVFTFGPKTGRIESMIILYDTHPIREAVGDKYS